MLVLLAALLAGEGDLDKLSSRRFRGAALIDDVFIRLRGTGAGDRDGDMLRLLPRSRAAGAGDLETDDRARPARRLGGEREEL